MIRKAILKDVNSIEDTYNEHFQYELNHTAFTVFKKGVYPTKDDAERAIYAGAPPASTTAVPSLIFTTFADNPTHISVPPILHFCCMLHALS